MTMPTLSIRSLMILASFVFIVNAFAQTTVPYQEDFESSNGGWSTSGTSSSWAHGTMTSGSKGWSTNPGGDYNVYELSYLVSPSFNFSSLSADPLLIFDMSYILENEYDFAWLEVSTNGGGSFTKLIQSTLTYDSDDRWTGSQSLTQYRVSLDGLAGEYSVIFRFVLDSDNAINYSGLSIDNVEISERPSVDLAITDVLLDPYAVTYDENVSIELTNLGSGDETNIPLELYVTDPSNQVTIISETYTPLLATNNSITYSFVESYPFTEIGSYSITAKVANTEDGYSPNDSINVLIKKLGTYTGGLPYEQDFEAADIATYGADIDSIPTAPGIGYYSEYEVAELDIYSDEYSYEESKSLRITRSEISTTISNLILTVDLASYSVSSDDVLFDFSFSHNGANNNGNNVVLIRGSESDNWILLYSWTSNRPEARYWKDVTQLDLSTLLSNASQEFSETTQISFGAYDNSPYDYFALDNLAIYERPADDVAITNITVPEHASDLGATESIVVEVSNYGSNQQTSIPLVVKIEGPAGTQTLSGTITDPISLGESATFTFNSQADFSTVGSYVVNAYTSLATDTYHENDSVDALRVFHQSVYSGGLPFGINFDSENDTTISFGAADMERESLSGFSFHSDNELGKMLISSNESYGNTGKSIQMTRQAYWDDGITNTLYFSIDLSGYSVASDNILLDLLLKVNGDESSTTDGVYVRGSSADEWLLLHEWNPNLIATNKVWQELEEESITDLLQTNGQEFSSSSQFKVVSYGVGGASSNVYGLWLDNFRVYKEPINEVELLALSLSSGESFYSSSEGVEVTIQNNGTSTQTSFPITIDLIKPNGEEISISETLSGSLAKGVSSNFNMTETLDMSLSGSYQLKAYLQLAGDEWNDNDSLTLEMIHYPQRSDLPYRVTVEDIEEAMYSPGAYEMEGLEGFLFESTSAGGQLTIIPPGGTYGATSQAIRLNGSSSAGYLTNDLILNLDLSTYNMTDDRLLMDFRFNNYNASSNAQNRVFVRGNADEEWLELYNWHEAATSVRTWYSAYKVAIKDTLAAHGQAYSGETQLKFSEYGYYYNALLLDDIKVYMEPDHDLGILSSNLPGKIAALSEEQLVSVEIVNKGVLDVLSYPMHLEIAGPSTDQSYNETANIAVPAGDTITYDFVSKVDFSEPGDYMVKIYSALATDEDLTNDTLVVELTKRSSYEGSLPYFVNFEESQDSTYQSTLGTDISGVSFVTDNVNGILSITSDEVGTNTSKKAFLSRAASGTFSVNSMILSADLKGYTDQDVLLDFDFTHISSSYSGSVLIRGSENDSWITVYDLYSQRPADRIWKSVQELNISETLANNSQVLTESFQVKFQDREYVAGNGFLLDNIKIYQRPPNDAMVYRIEPPAHAPDLTTSEKIVVQIINKGTEEIASLPITIELDGPEGLQEVTESASLNLASLDTVSYEFNSGFDFSFTGDYSVRAYTGLAADANLLNDTLGNIKVYSLSTYTGTLPYEITFDAIQDTTVILGTGGIDIDSLSGLGFISSSEDGVAKIVNSAWSYSAGTSLQLTRVNGLQSILSYVYFTADLSSYTADSDNVLFDFKFNERNETSHQDDGLYVRGSSDQPWLLLYKWDVASSSNYWRSVEALSISDTLNAHGQSVTAHTQLRFGTYGYRTPINGLWLDDLKIYREPVNELQLESISLVSEGPFYSDSENLQFTIINNGSATHTSIPVSIEIDGPNGISSFQETLSGSLAKEDTTTFNLSQTIDLTMAGHYQIKGVIELENDELLENDTLVIQSASYSKYEGELPYTIDFDYINDSTYAPAQYAIEGLEGFVYDVSGSSALHITSANSYGRSSQALRLSRASGVHSYSTNELILTVDLSGLDDTEDRLLLDFDFNNYYDYSSAANRVFVRGSTSDEWVELFDWYGTGSNRGIWQSARKLAVLDTLVAHDQTYSTETQIKFSEYGYSSNGLLIDDISVYTEVKLDLDLYDLQLVGEREFGTDAEELELVIINQGKSTVPEIPVMVSISGPSGNSSFEEALTAELASGDTATYTLDTKLDLSQSGTYTISAQLKLTGDEVSTNDSLGIETSFGSVYTGTLPYENNFNSLSDTTYLAGMNDGGLVGFSFISSNTTGRMKVFSEATDVNYTGTRALKLTREGVYANAVNDLIFTMDLSSLDTLDDELLLDFRFSHYHAYPFNENKVYVRGNSNDEWLVLYDWYANSAEYYEWVDVDEISILEVLSENGQKYSDRTQIKFSEREYGDDAFLLDDLKLHLTPPFDLLPISTGLEGKSASLGANQTFTVELTNLGNGDLTEFPIRVVVDGPSGNQVLDELVEIPLQRRDTITYLTQSGLDFSEPGDYEVTIFTALTEDSDKSNDTLMLQLTKVDSYEGGLPFLETFDLAPDSVYTTSTPSIGIDGFSFSTTNTNGKLEITSEALGTNQSKSARLNRGTEYVYSINSLILSVDMSDYINADVLLSFDFTQVDVSYYYSETAVYIRGNENQTWLRIYDWLDNKPESGVWKSVNNLRVSDLLAQRGQFFSDGFQIKFQDRAWNVGDGYFVDNIRLFERPAQDVQMYALATPESSSTLSDAETLGVQIVNQGAETISSIEFTYVVDGPSGLQEVTEVASLNVETLDTASYNFEHGFDLSMEGLYKLTAYASLTGDDITSNDTIRGEVFKNYSFTGSFPYFEDFEEDSARFRTYGQNSSWEYGTLKNDSKGWLTKEGSWYGHNDNELSYLQFPSFDFSSTENMILIGFDLDVELESCCDRAWLEMSINGAEFEKVIDDKLQYSQGDYWTGSDLLEVRSLQLSQVIGQADVSFRLVLSSDAAVDYDGLQLDNLQVYEQLTTDLKLSRIFSPEMSPLLGESETVSVELINEGVSEINDVTLSLSVVGDETVQIEESLALSINSLDTVVYSFTTGVDFSEAGDYKLYAKAVAAGDQNSYNDSLPGDVYHQQIYAGELPYTQNFDDGDNISVSGTSAIITGLPGFSLKSEDGRLYKAHDGILESVVMSVQGTTYNPLAQAILTIDLSDFQVESNEVLMSLNAYTYSIDSLNGIYLRGSSQDEWLTLYKPSERYQWISLENLSLSALLANSGQQFTESTQVMFSSNYASYGYFSFDDLNIFQRKDHDLEISNLVVPTSGLGLGTDEVLRVEVKNNGTETTGTLPLQVTIDGPEGIYETTYIINETLEMDSSTQVVLEGVDFSMDGDYLVTVSTTLTDDTTTYNDSKSALLYHQSVFREGLPYFEEFRDVVDTIFTTSRGSVGDLPGLAFIPSGSTSELSVQDAGNNTKSVRISKSSYQSTSESNQLILTVDLSAFTTADELLMDLVMRGRYYSSRDHYIYVRGDTSDVWLKLYDWQELNTFDFTKMEVTGLADTLAAYGQEFGSLTQIKFTENGTSSTYFLEIASIDLYTSPAADLEMIAIEPISMSSSHDNSVIEVTLFNNGQNAVSSIPLGATAVTADGTLETISYNLDIGLAPGDTASVVFDSFFDLSAVGLSDLKVYTSLADDERRYNDTLQTSVVTQSVYKGEFPILWQFEEEPEQVYTGISHQIGSFEGLSYQITGPGEVEIIGAEETGRTRELRLGNDNYEDVLIDLILTLDLSSYDTLSDEFEMRYKINGSSYPDLTLYVRANDGLEWQQVEELSNGSYITNLHDYVRETNTQYSSTTQVKFEYDSRDYWGQYFIDDFYLYNLSDNSAPTNLTLSPNVVAENLSDSFIGIVHSEDDDELTYTESTSGFYLVEDSLFASPAFDYESDSIYTVTVRATDYFGAFIEEELEVKVQDVNEPITNFTLSSYMVTEHNVNTVGFARFIVTDVDLYDTYSYEFINDELGIDNDRFLIEGDSLYAIGPNYEVDDAFSIHLKVIDGAGFVDTLSTSISIIDVSEPLVSIEILLEEINEDAVAGSLVATFTATDEDQVDQSFIYSIRGSDSFYSSENQMFTSLEFDFEGEDQVIPMEVKAKDAGGDSLVVGFDVIILDMIELGIEDEHILIYPNPTVNELYIENDRVTKVEAFDLSGVLIEQTETKKMLDTSQWKEGVYLLRIWVGDEFKDVKVIKQ